MGNVMPEVTFYEAEQLGSGDGVKDRERMENQ